MYLGLTLSIDDDGICWCFEFRVGKGALFNTVHLKLKKGGLSLPVCKQCYKHLASMAWKEVSYAQLARLTGAGYPLSQLHSFAEALLKRRTNHDARRSVALPTEESCFMRYNTLLMTLTIDSDKSPPSAPRTGFAPKL